MFIALDETFSKFLGLIMHNFIPREIYKGRLEIVVTYVSQVFATNFICKIIQLNNFQLYLFLFQYVGIWLNSFKNKF